MKCIVFILCIRIYIRDTITYPNIRVQICNKILDLNDYEQIYLQNISTKICILIQDLRTTFTGISLMFHVFNYSTIFPTETERTFNSIIKIIHIFTIKFKKITRCFCVRFTMQIFHYKNYNKFSLKNKLYIKIDLCETPSLYNH